MSVFFNGKNVTVADMIQARDQRNILQTTLLHKYPNKVLIAIKNNIPGPIKDNEALRNLLKIGMLAIKESLTQHNISILFEKDVCVTTGREHFYMIDTNDALNVKQQMMTIEQTHPLGRLFDIDVLIYHQNTIETISRKNFNTQTRRCLICMEDAKNCGRNRTHTLTELYQKIDDLIQNYQKGIEHERVEEE